MEIPKTISYELSQSERFVLGLKQLREECGLSSITYNAFGPTLFVFNDKSSVGCTRAFMNSGYIDEREFREAYNI